MISSVICATGSYIPKNKIYNNDFLVSEFFEKDNSRIKNNNSIVVEKFKEITGIEERRYADDNQQASDLGALAAQDALDSSNIDKETIDYIIVAHNFGDVRVDSNRSSLVPSLASRIKFLLKIKNPDCVAYDLPFGCPGWVEGMIQANYYIKSGDAKRCLVIGAETLSRVIDPHDRDSMIYSDGAGAVILEASNDHGGIIAHKTQTHAYEHAMLLSMDHSYSTNHHTLDDLFIKMNGRRVYEFALNHVPLLIKDVLDKANVSLTEISKVLIHQANGKMDTAILQKLYKLYGQEVPCDKIMPMTISWLGNSSVATVPTLLDLILKNKFPEQSIQQGNKVVFASVGAGMNINAILYQF
ncbi:MAG: ketoacyl-ACP synthase III [Cyclobacteriaceae bacterium]|nr:ketoacyl-ACP synthase III [Cyclobacteriaceae bacterium]